MNKIKGSYCSGDVISITSIEICLEDGILNCEDLGRYDHEELEEFRREIYGYFKKYNRHGMYYVAALTLINTELAIRGPPIETN